MTRETGETPRMQRVAMVNRKLKKKVFGPHIQEVDLTDIHSTNPTTITSAGSLSLPTGAAAGADELSTIDTDFIVENVLRFPAVEMVSTQNVDFAVGALRRREIDNIDCTGKLVSDGECSLLGKMLLGFKSNLKVML